MTASALAKEIARLHSTGEPLNISAVRRNHPELLDAAYSFTPFLGWKQALDLAGLDYRSIRTHLEPYVTCQVCGKCFRNLTTHLYGIHGYDGCGDYREEFPGAELVAEELRARIFKPEGASVPHWEPILSAEYLRDRVWFWHRHLGACNVHTIAENDPALLSYAYRLGWSWDDAIRSVGLDPREERLRNPLCRIPRAEILAHLRARQEQGRSTFLAVLHRESPSLTNSIHAEFGSLSRALEEAGLPDNRRTDTTRRAAIDYSDDRSVLKGLRAYAAAGHPVLKNALTHIDPVLAAAVNLRFPSFTACVMKADLWKAHLGNRNLTVRKAPAGIVFELRGKYPTVDAVLEALRARHRAGLSIYQTDVVQDDPPLKSAAYVRCGTWTNAIRMAGLTKARQQLRDATVRKDAVYPTAAATLDALRQRARNGGHMSQEAVSAENRPLKNAVYRYFGSWPAAIEAAGLTALLREQKKRLHHERTKGKYPCAEDVIAELKRRANEGQTLVLNRVIREDTPLKSAALVHFGTWLHALKAAGLTAKYYRDNPQVIVKYPDANSIVRELRRRKKRALSLSLLAVQREDSPLKSAAWRVFGSWSAALAAAFPS